MIVNETIVLKTTIFEKRTIVFKKRSFSIFRRRFHNKTIVFLKNENVNIPRHIFTVFYPFHKINSSRHNDIMAFEIMYFNINSYRRRYRIRHYKIPMIFGTSCIILSYMCFTVARSSLTKISPAAKPNILPLMKSVNNLTSSDLVSNLV